MDKENFKKIGLDKTYKEINEKDRRKIYEELAYYDTIYNTEGVLTSLYYNELTLEELCSTIEEYEKEEEMKTSK